MNKSDFKEENLENNSKVLNDCKFLSFDYL